MGTGFKWHTSVVSLHECAWVDMLSNPVSLLLSLTQQGRIGMVRLHLQHACEQLPGIAVWNKQMDVTACTLTDHHA